MTDDASRTMVLERIAHALAGAPKPAQPALPAEPAAGAGTDDRTVLAHRFAHELELVGGQTHFVAREGDLADAIAAYAAANGLGPASADLTTADYSLLRAHALLADSGSAIVIERAQERRLAPYFPRTCIIVADADALHPGLSAAALASVHAAARAGDRGEAVIITGPSRTADIEKTLVLGAHGPKTVAVFIVGVEPA